MDKKINHRSKTASFSNIYGTIEPLYYPKIEILSLTNEILQDLRFGSDAKLNKSNLLQQETPSSTIEIKDEPNTHFVFSLSVNLDAELSNQSDFFEPINFYSDSDYNLS